MIWTRRLGLPFNSLQASFATGLSDNYARYKGILKGTAFPGILLSTQLSLKSREHSFRDGYPLASSIGRSPFLLASVKGTGTYSTYIMISNLFITRLALTLRQCQKGVSINPPRKNMKYISDGSVELVSVRTCLPLSSLPDWNSTSRLVNDS
ncbi:hypothetical protein PNOK_0125700 [Pyrrhoderma noxium]|uniref:Uncharacterized protein n=1 Tax=Pyrrhoderma noxium TaxID=2282107 RepID=A0A286UX57_9AGAM|nr:hypothetical protein PNOK_0125700 [Pyrrhoderma noxium]